MPTENMFIPTGQLEELHAAISRLLAVAMEITNNGIALVTVDYNGAAQALRVRAHPVGQTFGEGSTVFDLIDCTGSLFLDFSPEEALVEIARVEGLLKELRRAGPTTYADMQAIRADAHDCWENARPSHGDEFDFCCNKCGAPLQSSALRQRLSE